MGKYTGYEEANLVQRVLAELYKKYANGIGIMTDEETKKYCVSFRYLNSLPEEFPTELLGVKIVTEQRSRAIAY